ncbi:FtsW/RodA/SpoVE family cell cycle protein [Antribacter gilvus]|uniref:FtsW/RodA/SpoVE family cell cycle protein n=1 Tax=Antribacter gilvus TaxID=2304675 RepID=UPI000F76A4AD|nr:FtsW/RodA/SpoVE family cell cycle protein [Antribacter gilvus]
MSAVTTGAAPGLLQTDERRPGRAAEATLLVVALVLSMGALAMVGITMVDGLPPGFWAYSLGLTGLSLGAHIVLRFRAPYADQVILPAVVLLNGIGLATILSLKLTGYKSMADADPARHFMWMCLSMAVALAVLWIINDHRNLRRYTYTAMIAGIVLVLLPLLPDPIGIEIHGARIWINLFGFSLQPAEFAKIAFAVFFAGYLVTNRDTLALAGRKVLGLQLPRARDLGPILIVWAVSLAVLVFQKDLGTSLLFFGLFVGMLYLATERGAWVIIGLIMFAGGAVLAWSIFGHVQARVDIWLTPFEKDIYERDPGGSYQVVQGLFGLANGGLFGAGWGEGMPRLIPFAFSDYIYASLGEQVGLTGLLGVLLVYLLIVERGLRTALGVRDGFGKLLAGGLAFVMALQLFVVVGGITRVIPLTGLTMPFLAQGGSSFLANWIVVALLLRMSDAARRPSALPMRGQLAGPAPVTVGHQDGTATGATPATSALPVSGGSGGVVPVSGSGTGAPPPVGSDEMTTVIPAPGTSGDAPSGATPTTDGPAREAGPW